MENRGRSLTPDRSTVGFFAARSANRVANPAEFSTSRFFLAVANPPSEHFQNWQAHYYTWKVVTMDGILQPGLHTPSSCYRDTPQSTRLVLRCRGSCSPAASRCDDADWGSPIKVNPSRRAHDNLACTWLNQNCSTSIVRRSLYAVSEF
jgi:hypothetical protein